MTDFRAIVIRGPFSEDDMAMLVETLRQIDERHGGTDTFELAALDPRDTALEAAEEMLHRVVPDHPNRVTAFTTIRRRRH